MSNRFMIVAVAALIGVGGAADLVAQSPAAAPSPATRPASDARLPGAGSNGVGTSGSLDRDAGTASSTVAGVHGGTTPMGAQPANKGAHGLMESEPALGGDAHPRRETPASQPSPPQR